MRSPVLWALLGLAAALRFSTLDVQSYNFDELTTVRLIELPFGEMLSTIPDSESTPPLYYVVAWGWAKLLGTGEYGLRALSALMGTATVVVAFLAARELFPARRIAFITAALVATSPWMVWHSQEARSYVLVTLLGALSLLFFARARRYVRRRDAIAWAAVSALALATHYFAAFLVAPEAIWLLVAARRRRTAFGAVGGVGLAGLALLPLALDQRATGNGDAMIADSGSTVLRTVQLPKQSLIGYDTAAEPLLTAVAGALCLLAIVLLVARGDPESRPGARTVAVLGLAAIAIPLALALAGIDYVVTRNLIVAWLPLAMLVATGLGARRARRLGTAAAALLCAVFMAATVSVALDEGNQRDDWRGVGRALGPTHVPRAIVLTPESGPKAYAAYVPRLGWLPERGAEVSDIVVVAVGNVASAPGRGRRTPRPRVPAPAPAPGFRETSRTESETFIVIHFRASERVRVTPGQLRRSGLEPKRPAATFLQHAPGG